PRVGRVLSIRPRGASAWEGVAIAFPAKDLSAYLGLAVRARNYPRNHAPQPPEKEYFSPEAAPTAGGTLVLAGTMTRLDSIFETPRLIMRRFRPGDLVDTFEILSDPEVAKYEFWEPYNLEETAEDIGIQAAVTPGTVGVWNEFAAQLRDGGKVIGNISFR